MTYTVEFIDGTKISGVDDNTIILHLLNGTTIKQIQRESK